MNAQVYSYSSLLPRPRHPPLADATVVSDGVGADH